MLSINIYEKIMFNNTLIELLSDDKLIYIINNHNNLMMFQQNIYNNCVFIAILSVISYLFNVKYFDPNYLYLSYKRLINDDNDNGSFMLETVEYINKMIKEVDIVYGVNIFSVKCDWDIIRYYLVSNYPLIVTILNPNMRYHTTLIYGFSNDGKLYLKDKMIDIESFENICKEMYVIKN